MIFLRIGLIPLGLLVYGLVAKRRWAIWVGGIWLALNLVFVVAQPKAPR